MPGIEGGDGLKSVFTAAAGSGNRPAMTSSSDWLAKAAQARRLAAAATDPVARATLSEVAEQFAAEAAAAARAHLSLVPEAAPPSGSWRGRGRR